MRLKLYTGIYLNDIKKIGVIMKIKTKLYSLILIMVLSIVIAVGTNMFTTLYTNRLRVEEKSLIALRDLMLQQTIEFSKLLYNNIPTIIQYETLRDKIDETNEILEIVKKS